MSTIEYGIKYEACIRVRTYDKNYIDRNRENRKLIKIKLAASLVYGIPRLYKTKQEAEFVARKIFPGKYFEQFKVEVIEKKEALKLAVLFCEIVSEKAILIFSQDGKASLSRTGPGKSYKELVSILNKSSAKRAVPRSVIENNERLHQEFLCSFPQFRSSALSSLIGNQLGEIYNDRNK